MSGLESKKFSKSLNRVEVDLLYVLDQYTSMYTLHSSSLRYLIKLYNFENIINFLGGLIRRYEWGDREKTDEYILIFDELNFLSNFFLDIEYLKSEISVIDKELNQLKSQSSLFVNNIPDIKIKEKFTNILSQIDELKKKITEILTILNDILIFKKTYSLNQDKLVPGISQVLIHINRYKSINLYP